MFELVNDFCMQWNDNLNGKIKREDTWIEGGKKEKRQNPPDLFIFHIRILQMASA